MTVSGQFSCPPAGSFVAVSGQFLVTAHNRIRVTPHNAAGAGPSVQSEPIHPVKTADAPAAPLLELQRIPGGAHAYWSANGDGGSPITHFQWLLEGPDGVIEGSGGSETQRTFSAPELGQMYRVTVYAHNAIGDGPTAIQEFVAADVPTAPRKLKARPRKKSVVLTWKPPRSAQGAPVTGYRVSSSAVGRGMTVSANKTKVRIKRLRRGKKHTFSVAALNEMGLSPSARSRAIQLK